MKRLLLTAIILLASSVWLSAADFSSSLADMRIQVKARLGIHYKSVGAISDSTLNRLIREAAVTLAPTVIGISRPDTILTVFKQNMYLLDSTVLTVLDVWWRKGDSIKALLYTPRRLWYEQELQTLVGKKGYKSRPSFFDYFRVSDDTCYLTIYPSPIIASETLFVLTRNKVADIATSPTIDELTQADRAKIINYAAYLAALNLGYPDPERYLMGLTIGVPSRTNQDSIKR